MNNNLPHFQWRPYPMVHDYISRVLTNTQQSDDSFLRDLIAYNDGHYRAVFNPDYFVLAEGRAEPSKSQWNTLKKKMKRHHPGVFVFKAHGTTIHEGDASCYVDFGFFAD